MLQEQKYKTLHNQLSMYFLLLAEYSDDNLLTHELKLLEDLVKSNLSYEGAYVCCCIILALSTIYIWFRKKRTASFFSLTLIYTRKSLNRMLIFLSNNFPKTWSDTMQQTLVSLVQNQGLCKGEHCLTLQIRMHVEQRKRASSPRFRGSNKKIGNFR